MTNDHLQMILWTKKKKKKKTANKAKPTQRFDAGKNFIHHIHALNTINRSFKRSRVLTIFIEAEKTLSQNILANLPLELLLRGLLLTLSISVSFSRGNAFYPVVRCNSGNSFVAICHWLCASTFIHYTIGIYNLCIRTLCILRRKNKKVGIPFSFVARQSVELWFLTLYSLRFEVNFLLH